MLVRSPITIRLTSARSTQLYHTELSAPIVTLPTMVQPGAMNALSWICGVLPWIGTMVTPGRDWVTGIPSS